MRHRKGDEVSWVAARRDATKPWRPSAKRRLSAEADQIVRQRADVLIRGAIHDGVHARVDPRAPSLAISGETVRQVVEPLTGEPRHLLAAGIARKMAGGAEELLRQHRSLR